MYTGPVFLGTPLQKPDAKFMYDTGSGVLTATSTDCYMGCSSRVYNPSASTTCNTTDSRNDTLEYGSANLTGTFMRDHVCLPSSGGDDQLCVQNLTLFAITQAQGFDGLDGIVGFSPVVADQPMESNTHIVRGLYEAGLIGSEVATFQINGRDAQS